MSLRGILRGFGLKVGGTTPVRFASRIGELTEHHPTLSAIAGALLAVHAVLLRELNGFERQVRKQAKSDDRVRLVMTAPGVGAIVGLTPVFTGAGSMLQPLTIRGVSAHRKRLARILA
jgi:transposase